MFGWLTAGRSSPPTIRNSAESVCSSVAFGSSACSGSKTADRSSYSTATTLAAATAACTVSAATAVADETYLVPAEHRPVLERPAEARGLRVRAGEHRVHAGHRASGSGVDGDHAR